MCWVRWAKLGWGVALLCWAPRALAEGGQATYALSWVRAEGAEECPTARALAAEVERRLGRPVFDAAAARSFEVQVTRVAGVYHSDVFVRDESGHAIGHRSLKSDEPGCAALFGATALAMALVIDPDGASRAPGDRAVAAFDAPAPPPAPLSPAPPPPALPVARQPDRPVVNVPAPPPPTAVSVSLRGQLSAGLVPAVSPGFALAVGARPTARWGWALVGSYSAPQVARVGVGDIEVGLTRAALAVTFDAARGRRARLVLSAGPSLGAFHVAVREPLPVTDTGDFWFVATELGAGLQVAVSNAVFMEFGGAGLVPLLRQEFFARGQVQPIWSEPRFSATAYLGLGALFP